MLHFACVCCVGVCWFVGVCWCASVNTIYVYAYFYVYVYLCPSEYFSFSIGLKAYTKKGGDMVVAKARSTPTLFWHIRNKWPKSWCRSGTDDLHFYVMMD